MARIVLKTPKECRNAYRDVLQGYTLVSNGSKYIKHFAEEDLGLLENIYNSYKLEAIELGLITKVDKLKLLRDEGHWTEDEEIAHKNAQMALIDTENHASKLVMPEQKEAFKKEIAKERKNLRDIERERNLILNPTVETFCDKRINEDYVYNAIYKDKELKNPYYTEEEFDDLTYREIADLIQEYNIGISSYDEKNIKRIACNSFFLNAFLMSDNDPVKFYGKPVLELTIYQMNLYSRGKFCKSILQEGKEPPEQYYQDQEEGVENLMNWFDNQYNIIISDRNQKQMMAKQKSSLQNNRPRKSPRKRRRR